MLTKNTIDLTLVCPMQLEFFRPTICRSTNLLIQGYQIKVKHCRADNKKKFLLDIADFSQYSGTPFFPGIRAFPKNSN